MADEIEASGDINDATDEERVAGRFVGYFERSPVIRLGSSGWWVHRSCGVLEQSRFGRHVVDQDADR